MANLSPKKAYDLKKKIKQQVNNCSNCNNWREIPLLSVKGKAVNKLIFLVKPCSEINKPNIEIRHEARYLLQQCALCSLYRI